MIPTTKDTYDALRMAVDHANRLPEFGSAMMKSRGGRERLLSTQLALALHSMGFDAKPEQSDGKRGKIDVLVANATGHERVIELKLYYCYSMKEGSSKHVDLWNTYTDFLKRAHRGGLRQ